MAVQIAPLQLEGYYVQELSFRIKPGLDDEINCKMQVGLGFQMDGLFDPDPLVINVLSGVAAHKEDPFRWKVFVRVESQTPPDRKYPYEFLVVVMGFLKVHEQVPHESIDNLVKINGASILYSVAREVLASATGRGLFPNVLLPTVVFTVDEEPEQKQLPAKKEDEPVQKAAKKRAGKRAAKKSKSKKKSG